MSTESENVERVFDLMLLGLTWVQEKAIERSPSRVPGWTGNGVLQTMRASNVLSEQTCRIATTRPPRSLRDYALTKSHLETLSGRRDSVNRLVLPSHGRLSELTTRSDKQLLVMVSTPMYFGDMIFKPRGYLLLVSDKGRAYAHGIIADKYKSEVSENGFLEKWSQHARRMRSIYGKNPTFSQK
jgi:hypothetical protein